MSSASEKPSATWSQLRAWDKAEEDEIRKFERIRDKDTYSGILWQKFKSYPIPILCVPLASYCIFAGLNALQTGHTYMALKYLELRIAFQATAVVSIFFGSVYYNFKDKHDLVSLQPYGPYHHGYGKVHPIRTTTNTQSLFQ